MFVDSHCHVDDERYDEDRAETLARAREAGVTAMLEICGGNLTGGLLPRAMQLLDDNADIYGAVGVHPHDAKIYDDALEAELRDLARHPKMLAWGEIGLDYYYDNSPRETQRAVLVRQMAVARELDLPIILHSRDADDDMIDLLREHWSDRREHAGIFHCFSGSEKLAQVGLELGFLISFSGNITFKKAQDLRDIAANLPLDRILIETDCPYLAPEPFRGRRNEPARVVEVARKLAELHGTTVEDIGRITTANFFRFFNLPQPEAA